MTTVQRRWAIGSRVLAAAAGGYIATALLAAAFARLLPLSRADAAHASTLLSFAVYTGIVLAVFHAASARRAWLIVAVMAFGGLLLSMLAGAPA